MDTKDCRMHAEEFPMHTKKFRALAKSPRMHANFSRMVGKVPRKLADVFSQAHSGAPKLAETRFMHTFFPRIMHEE